MAVASQEWLKLIEQEYISSFIIGGGAAVKFVVADDSGIARLRPNFAILANGHGMVFVSVDSAHVKLHMMQDVFFAISRQVDWSGDAQKFVEELFRENGYDWPRPGDPVALKDIADANNVDATILRREFNGWLTGKLMRDTRMAQDFRIALMQLCLNRLTPAGHDAETVAPILQWLRGELKILSPLKSSSIYSKITRHNARPMLRSLCRWLTLCGHGGLFVAIDIRQLTRTASMVPEGVRYSSGAVMDAYEVLRQLVDDSDAFESFLVTVLADRAFIDGDRKRSVDAYTALKMRIWDDVRAKERDNPLAPMVVLSE